MSDKVISDGNQIIVHLMTSAANKFSGYFIADSGSSVNFCVAKQV